MDKQAVNHPKMNQVLDARLSGLLVLSLIALSPACTKMQFSGGSSLPQVATGISQASLSDGACNDQQVLLSCLSCANPTPPAPPVLSLKARKLMSIMEMACPIYYSQDPVSNALPDKAKIDSYLAGCTADLYPDDLNAYVNYSTISNLFAKNATGNAIRQTVFGGLYYTPPLSDDFEYYFGLEVKEAAYVFCKNDPSYASGLLQTGDWMLACSGAGLGDPVCDAWTNNPAAQLKWQAAQTVRQQLLSCLNKPATSIPANPAPPSTKSCTYHSFSGDFSLGGAQEIAKMLSEGYTIAADTGDSCTQITSGQTTFSGVVKITGYICK